MVAVVYCLKKDTDHGTGDGGFGSTNVVQYGGIRVGT
jgi:hypothetical protein